jgi:hypothetical protein
VVDSQRIPEILQPAVIDEVRLKEPLETGGLMELLDHRLDPAKLAICEVSQRLI